MQYIQIMKREMNILDFLSQNIFDDIKFHFNSKHDINKLLKNKCLKINGDLVNKDFVFKANKLYKIYIDKVGECDFFLEIKKIHINDGRIKTSTLLIYDLYFFNDLESCYREIKSGNLYINDIKINKDEYLCRNNIYEIKYKDRFDVFILI